VSIALNLVPFAGIAFLWLIGVIRDRIGGREDRFFATVFLGSGLLFVGMLFVAAAVAGGLITVSSSRSSGAPGADTLALGRSATSILLNVYAMRMAAVFTLTTVTIARRTEIVSRWLVAAGVATAVVLLAKKFSQVVDAGAALIGAPPAFAGILVALLILLPESVAAVGAARKNDLQKSINLALGYLGVPKPLGVVVAATLIMIAACTGNFRRFERFSLLLVLGSLLLVPVFLMVHPPVGQMVGDVLMPRLPHDGS